MKRHRLLLLLVPALALAEEGGLSFRMKQHPSLRFGRILRIDFRAVVQSDFRGFRPELDGPELFDLHRARVGIQGRFLRDFDFEVERELSDTKNPWRDVYVEYRRFRSLQLRAGKFKIPLGLDQLTGYARQDFIYRSRIGTYLAPGRDIGVQLHGRLFERGFRYQAGFFRQDGENARTSEGRGAAGQTIATRLTGAPLRLAPLPEWLQDLELGVAFTSSSLPEGLNGLRGRTVAKEYFFRQVYVNGGRRRLGAELNWAPGPFSLKGEFIQANDERRGQGLFGQDLPDLIVRGWYLSGTWLVAGHKPGRALELAARTEQIRFSSSEHPGRPSRHPRAANLLGNSDRLWTFGANWYLNRFVKLQVNGVREHIEDLQRSPIPGQSRFWTVLGRMQFEL